MFSLTWEEQKKNQFQSLNLHFDRTKSNELEQAIIGRIRKKISDLSRNWDRLNLRIWVSVFPLLSVSLPFGSFCFWSRCASRIFSSFLVVINPELREFSFPGYFTCLLALGGYKSHWASWASSLISSSSVTLTWPLGSRGQLMQCTAPKDRRNSCLQLHKKTLAANTQ